jgi:hypothetical protein
LTTAGNAILANANITLEVLDSLGRKLSVRRINALDRLRLLKAAGPELSDNDAWLNMAALAISVVEMNGIPFPTPTNERQVESSVSALGDQGLQAVADALGQEDNISSLLPSGPPGGNAEGTPC